MRSRLSPNVVSLLSVVFVASYFLYFSRGSLRAEFGSDDLMNCYFAWLRPFGTLLAENVLFFRPSSVFRPLGALAYKASFEAFGFNLFPLRLILLFMLAAKVFFTYAVTRRLAGSQEAGLLAAIIGAYHGFMSHLLYNTGQLYDVFCFFFYFLALTFYLRVRASGCYLSPLQTGVFASLLILALDSKEMAATLPVMIGVYELIFHPPSSLRLRNSLRWLWREGRTACVGGLIAFAFVIGRATGPQSISQIGAYQLNLAGGEYLNQAGHYIGALFYRTERFGNLVTLFILAATLAVALLMRSKALFFSWTLFTAGILPLAFTPPRGLETAVIPATGFMMYGAILLLRLRDGALRVFFRPAPSPAVPWKAVVCILPLTLFLLRAHHSSEEVYRAWLREFYHPIRSMREQLKRLHPEMRRGSRILFVSDPFSDEYHDPIFLARLVYRDETLTVDRLKTMNPKPNAQVMASYDYVFSYENGVLSEVNRRPAALIQTLP